MGFQCFRHASSIFYRLPIGYYSPFKLLSSQFARWDNLEVIINPLEIVVDVTRTRQRKQVRS